MTANVGGVSNEAFNKTPPNVPWNRLLPESLGLYKRATMNRNSWKQSKNSNEAYRRAGGRRRFNAARRRLAARRLLPLSHRIAIMGNFECFMGSGRGNLWPRSLIPALARELGVHRSTVWRDVRRLQAWPKSWEFRGATGMATVRLYGLAKFSYRF
jgi:HTH domain